MDRLDEFIDIAVGLALSPVSMGLKIDVLLMLEAFKGVARDSVSWRAHHDPVS